MKKQKHICGFFWRKSVSLVTILLLFGFHSSAFAQNPDDLFIPVMPIFNDDTLHIHEVVKPCGHDSFIDEESGGTWVGTGGDIHEDFQFEKYSYITGSPEQGTLVYHDYVVDRKTCCYEFTLTYLIPTMECSFVMVRGAGKCNKRQVFCRQPCVHWQSKRSGKS